MTDKDTCRTLIDKVSLELKTLSLRLDNKVSYNNLGQYALDTEVGSRDAYMANLVKALGNIDDMLCDAVRGKEV
jgi:hypothetical protein